MLCWLLVWLFAVFAVFDVVVVVVVLVGCSEVNVNVGVVVVSGCLVAIGAVVVEAIVGIAGLWHTITVSGSSLAQKVS